MKETSILESKKPFKLVDKQKVFIELALKEIFEEKKVFIQTQYTLSHLSAETKLSTNYLSIFFNQILSLHFNDYINRLRINYFLEMMETGEAHLFTLAGLAEKCGFHNRNTFTSAFKKVMGQKPSEYVRQQVSKKLSRDLAGALPSLILPVPSG